MTSVTTAPKTVEEAASSYPQRVGRYELLLPIGTGGMATVHLARTQVVGDLYREVALKLMHAHFRAEDGEWSTHLLEEAKLAARIRHPNVVSVLEVGEGSLGVYLVMEYVEGDTLSGLVRAARTRGEPLPLAVAGRILADALSGLHAAHELTDDHGEHLGLVHRDFSPQNILVGSDGVSRLTDFGIAKAAGRVGVTSSGIIKGKVGYMAPEQALGKRVDRRCDVWAAGVVAWELLSGRRLYKQEDQVSTLLKIVQEPPPPLSSVREDVPPALEEVVSAALTMDAEKRIPSALELRRLLIEAWRSEGGLADVGDVGEAVRDLARAKLEKRRLQVSQVIRLREKMERVSRSAIETAAADAGTPSYPRVEEPSADVPSLTSPSEIAALHSIPPSLAPAKPRRNRLVGLALFSGVVIVLAASALLFMRRAEEVRPDVLAAAAPVATGESPKPAPTPSAPPAPARPVSKPLAVSANLAIAKLSIGGKVVTIERASRELSVPADAISRGDGQLEVEAQSVDGRQVQVRIDGDTEKLELSFPPAPTSFTKPKRPVRNSPSKRPEPPGLAPTPYGNP